VRVVYTIVLIDSRDNAIGRVVYDNKSLFIIEFLLLQILRYAFAL
jgi:hypothetical protein